MIPQHILDRKGARSLKDLNPEVIEYLNQGLVETKNLMEWLATDQLQLLKLVLKEINKEDLPAILAYLDARTRNRVRSLFEELRNPADGKGRRLARKILAD